MKALITYLFISIMVAFLMVLPILIRRSKNSNLWSNFLQYFISGIVIFYITLPVLNWWTMGVVTGFALWLPTCIRQYNRERGMAIFSLVAGMIHGFIIVFIKAQLPAIATYLTATT